jgi:hypothetical protein
LVTEGRMGDGARIDRETRSTKGTTRTTEIPAMHQNRPGLLGLPRATSAKVLHDRINRIETKEGWPLRLATTERCLTAENNRAMLIDCKTQQRPAGMKISY